VGTTSTTTHFFAILIKEFQLKKNILSKKAAASSTCPSDKMPKKIKLDRNKINRTKNDKEST